jgi:F0F1-type ATP synthase assembly protein I
MNQGPWILVGFLGLQAVVVGLVSVVAAIVWSLSAGFSALLAGASVWAGNLAYASLLIPRGRGSFVWVFVGQFVKVLVTLLLLFLVVAWYPALVWPGFLSGLFAALLVILAAPAWIAKRQRKRDAQRVDSLVETLSKQ